MVTTATLLFRVFIALLLGLAGLMAVLVGLYLLVGGAPGVMIVGVLAGVGLLYGCVRLLRAALTVPTA